MSRSKLNMSRRVRLAVSQNETDTLKTYSFMTFSVYIIINASELLNFYIPQRYVAFWSLERNMFLVICMWCDTIQYDTIQSNTTQYNIDVFTYAKKLYDVIIFLCELSRLRKHLYAVTYNSGISNTFSYREAKLYISRMLPLLMKWLLILICTIIENKKLCFHIEGVSFWFVLQLVIPHI